MGHHQGITEVLASHLSDEAGLANAPAVVPAPVFQTPTGLSPSQLQILQDVFKVQSQQPSQPPQSTLHLVSQIIYFALVIVTC